MLNSGGNLDMRLEQMPFLSSVSTLEDKTRQTPCRILILQISVVDQDLSVKIQMNKWLALPILYL